MGGCLAKNLTARGYKTEVMCPIPRRAEEVDGAARTIQRILVREVDPISRGAVRRPFRLGRGGASLLYDAETLFDFISQTGDLRDPLSREPIVPHEISRLERAAERSLPTRTTLEASFREEAERTHLIDFFVNELISDPREEVAVAVGDNLGTVLRTRAEDAWVAALLAPLPRRLTSLLPPRVSSLIPAPSFPRPPSPTVRPPPPSFAKDEEESDGGEEGGDGEEEGSVAGRPLVGTFFLTFPIE